MTPTDDEVRTSRHLMVSGRIRLRRQTLGLTQKQVANRLGRLGVTSTNKLLSSLEHGAGVDVARLPELADALDCTVTWLLGLTDDPHRWEPDRPVRNPAARPASAPSRRAPTAPARSDVQRAEGRHTRARGTRARAVANDSSAAAHRPWIIGPVSGPERP